MEEIIYRVYVTNLTHSFCDKYVTINDEVVSYQYNVHKDEMMKDEYMKYNQNIKVRRNNYTKVFYFLKLESNIPENG